MKIDRPIFPFVQGADYTRQSVLEIVGVPSHTGGDWFTGYHEHEGDFFVFCGVGSPGRTGHDYGNHFDGDELVWYGKTTSRLNTPRMQRMVDPGTRVYIFFREGDRDPFTFAGMGTPVNVTDTTPVQVRWQLSGASMPSVLTLPEEIPGTATVLEGARKTISVNVYERNPNARRKCIERWGVVCCVCGFDFKQVYGVLGEGFIHVHHLKPLGEIGEAYELDPVEDLRPVCPNCHAMLHRRDPALGIEDLAATIRTRS